MIIFYIHSFKILFWKEKKENRIFRIVYLCHGKSICLISDTAHLLNYLILLNV